MKDEDKRSEFIAYRWLTAISFHYEMGEHSSLIVN
jgi:hypothetical protein